MKLLVDIFIVDDSKFPAVILHNGTDSMSFDQSLLDQRNDLIFVHGVHQKRLLVRDLLIRLQDLQHCTHGIAVFFFAHLHNIVVRTASALLFQKFEHPLLVAFADFLGFVGFTHG